MFKIISRYPYIVTKERVSPTATTNFESQRYNPPTDAQLQESANNWYQYLEPESVEAFEQGANAVLKETQEKGNLYGPVHLFYCIDICPNVIIENPQCAIPRKPIHSPLALTQDLLHRRLHNQ